MTALKQNDPVTVISRRLLGIGPTAAWVSGVHPGGLRVTRYWGDAMDVVAIFDSEGVDWIRGHHPHTCFEILALEAAHALATR